MIRYVQWPTLFTSLLPLKYLPFQVSVLLTKYELLTKYVLFTLIKT